MNETKTDAPTFKRHGDPHGCPERSGHNCLGVRMHCRLESGHQPLRHDYDDMGCTAPPDDPGCAGPGLCHRDDGVGSACGEPPEAHGTPHAMEVSGPYVLEHSKEPACVVVRA
jgi:hypothetical protein